MVFRQIRKHLDLSSARWQAAVRSGPRWFLTRSPDHQSLHPAARCARACGWLPVAVALLATLGSGPSRADQSSTADLPTVSVSADQTALQLDWPTGEQDRIEVQRWQLSLLDSFSCSLYRQIPQRSLSARWILGQPAMDERTGHIAVAVLLEECLEVQKTAVFIVDPQGPGTHALYRLRVPGDRPLPHEFASYPLSSITGLRYWDSTLLVRHGDATGASALLIFRPGRTPSGEYAGCALLVPGEGGSDRLCPPPLPHSSNRNTSVFPAPR